MDVMPRFLRMVLVVQLHKGCLSLGREGTELLKRRLSGSLHEQRFPGLGNSLTSPHYVRPWARPWPAKLIDTFHLSTPFIAKAGRHYRGHMWRDSHPRFTQELQPPSKHTALVLRQDGSGGRGPRKRPRKLVNKKEGKPGRKRPAKTATREPAYHSL
jgi:hypothetical protein